MHCHKLNETLKSQKWKLFDRYSLLLTYMIKWTNESMQQEL